MSGRRSILLDRGEHTKGCIVDAAIASGDETLMSLAIGGYRSRRGRWKAETPKQRARLRMKPPSADHVYFIQADVVGLIKIGRAQDPHKRLADLQIGSPVHLRLLALIERGGSALEGTLHEWFKELHAHGEWFRPSPSLLAFIAALPPLEPRA